MNSNSGGCWYLLIVEAAGIEPTCKAPTKNCSPADYESSWLVTLGYEEFCAAVQIWTVSCDIVLLGLIAFGIYRIHIRVKHVVRFIE